VITKEEIRILAVDDDDAVLFLVDRILSKQGYTVKTTVSPREALQMLQGSRFDLLITDIEMPELTGIEMVRIAKANIKNLPPILILSSKNTVDVVLKAKDAGVSYYLVKPFSTTDLILKVSSILEKHKNA
jgi:two-component system chemotaxis response regulator CheY